MLVIAALFALVTVGFNTASYADGPRNLGAAHVMTVSVTDDVSKTISPAGSHVRVPRHLAHQPQIMPPALISAIAVSAIQQDWLLPRSMPARSQIVIHLLRPPQSRPA